jgi:hypothetical protein
MNKTNAYVVRIFFSGYEPHLSIVVVVVPEKDVILENVMILSPYYNRYEFIKKHKHVYIRISPNGAELIMEAWNDTLDVTQYSYVYSTTFPMKGIVKHAVKYLVDVVTTYQAFIEIMLQSNIATILWLDIVPSTNDMCWQLLSYMVQLL